MIYTVIWVPSATSALADIWMNAPDRLAVTSASNEIDRQLGVDAHKKGQAFHDGRLLVIRPLAVTFKVDPADRKVFVLQVGRIA